MRAEDKTVSVIITMKHNDKLMSNLHDEPVSVLYLGQTPAEKQLTSAAPIITDLETAERNTL